MTDRYSTLTVALEHDIREDDARSLMDAIRHFRGVITVSGNVSNMAEWLAEMRVRRELSVRLAEVLLPPKESGA